MVATRLSGSPFSICHWSTMKFEEAKAASPSVPDRKSHGPRKAKASHGIAHFEGERMCHAHFPKLNEEITRVR